MFAAQSRVGCSSTRRTSGTGEATRSRPWARKESTWLDRFRKVSVALISKRNKTATKPRADLKTLRRAARRRGVLAVCICVALALVALAFEVAEVWEAASDGDTLRAAGSAFLVMIPVAIVLAGSAVYILRELRRSPLIICGRTVAKVERLEAPPPYEDIGLALRLVEGPRWMIDVNCSCRLNNGAVSMEDLDGEQEVRLTRKLYRALNEDEYVVLLCTAGGKGFRRLPCWPSWAHGATAQPTAR